MSGSAGQRAAFYCVCDERFFLGAVGMINSLRLVGHTEPVFVLDCGLTPAQRELLAPEATMVAAPRDAPPYLLKTIAPLERPAPVRVLIDADMIVTRPLTGLIDEARRDRVVTFENDRDRFVPGWGELLDLGPVRRRRYVTVALVILGGSVGDEVLRLMDDRQGRVDIDQTFVGANHPDYPLRYPEQDVLNAVLSSRVDPNRIISLQHRLAATPPFGDLKVLDEIELRCAYRDGTEPYVIHQFVRKPWLERMYHSPYSRLLARVLLGPDVPIRVPESEVPRRMRTGLLARAERALVNAEDLGRWYLGERLPRWIGSRVRALRRRGATGGS